MIPPNLSTNIYLQTIRENAVLWRKTSDYLDAALSESSPEQKSKDTEKEIDKRVDSLRDRMFLAYPHKTSTDLEQMWTNLVDSENPLLEKNAIDEIRNLNSNLEGAQNRLVALSRIKGLTPGLKAAIREIDKVYKMSDDLLLVLGRNKHEREFALPKAQVKALETNMRNLRLMDVGDASASASKEVQLIPQSKSRPYRTRLKVLSRDKSADEINGIIVKNIKDILQKTTDEKIPPRILSNFRSGIYTYNGHFSPQDLPIDPKKTYLQYCKLLTGISSDSSIGRIVASLMDSENAKPLTARAEKIAKKMYGDLNEKRTVLPTQLFCDLSVQNKNVTITFKEVYEIKTSGESRCALLMKREIIIPLKDLEEVAKTVDSAEQGKESLNDLKNVTVIDFESSPIGTVELASSWLHNF